MIVKLFRDNQLFVVFISFLVSIFLWVISGFYKVYIPSDDTVYYSSVFQVFPVLEKINNYQAIAALFNVILLLLGGFYLSNMMVRHQIIPRRTTLPLLIFMVLSMPYFYYYSGFSYPLVTFLALLVILDLLFRSIDNKATSLRFFDIALLLSLASLINFYLIFFVIFLLFVWILFRRAFWRELVFLILGIALPYVFYISALYLTDRDIQPVFNNFVDFTRLEYILSFNTFYYVLAGYSALLLIITSVNILRNYGKIKIITRKYSLIFLSLFLSTLLIPLLFRAVDHDFIFYLSLPLSFLFSYYFTTCRTNFINNLLFIILILGNLALVLLK